MEEKKKKSYYVVLISGFWETKKMINCLDSLEFGGTERKIWKRRGRGRGCSSSGDIPGVREVIAAAQLHEHSGQTYAVASAQQGQQQQQQQ